MNIPKDKQLHLVAGFVIAIVFSWFTYKVAGLEHSAFVGFAVATVVGWGKEYIWDKNRPGKNTVDKKDFEFTAAGGLVGSVVYAVCQYFIR